MLKLKLLNKMNACYVDELVYFQHLYHKVQQKSDLRDDCHWLLRVFDNKTQLCS